MERMTMRLRPFVRSMLKGGLAMALFYTHGVLGINAPALSPWETIYFVTVLYAFMLVCESPK